MANNNHKSLFPITKENLRSLLDEEDKFLPQSNYFSCSLHLTARHDAINWIIKVSDFYRFTPVTVYLAINYLDRFLSVHSLPVTNNENKQSTTGSWPLQLLSVACLSVAAKMEEIKVPLLLDLQISNPVFVFEPKTLCRMELLLMSALQWRLRAVTPFDFISYFASDFIFSGDSATAISHLFSRSEYLILSTFRVPDFLGFRPSVIAAAAVLCAADEIGDYDSGGFDFLVNMVNSIANFLHLPPEMVRDCRQLMEEYLIDTCQAFKRDTQMLSPAGVLDLTACGECDTVKSSSDLPPAKRGRRAERFCTRILNTGDCG